MKNFLQLLSLCLFLTGTTFSTSAQSLCATPNNLQTSLITASSAKVSWQPASTNTAYYFLQFRLVTVPQSNWTQQIVQTTYFTLSNLACNSAYEWRVQAACSSNTGTSVTSDFSAIQEFVTLSCNTTTCPTPIGLSSAGVTASNAMLSWNMPAGALGFTIKYRPVTTPASNWISLNATTNSISLSNLICNTTYEWQVQSYCGSGANGTGLVSDPSAIATFTTQACATNTCETPTGTATYNITANSAKFSWNASVSSNAYIVKYRPLNPANSNWITVTASTNYVMVNNLTCGTAYEWQVQRVCYNGSNTPSYSDFTASTTFTTLACSTPCPVPTNLSAIEIGMYSAKLSWSSSGAALYYIKYKAANSTTWITVTTQNTYFILNNLNCNTTYEWQVQAFCNPTNASGTNNASGYSTVSTFTTLACPSSCSVPGGTNTINISMTGAKLIWNVVPGVSTYRVRYRPVTSPASSWTIIIINQNYLQLSNLNCNTQYEWQVRSVCPATNSTGSSTLSSFSASVFFTTLSCQTNLNCPAPTGLNATSANIGTATGGTLLTWNSTNALSYNIRYKNSANGTWMLTTSNTNSKVLYNLSPNSTYIYQVQSVCATSNGITYLSNWSEPFTFTTPQQIVAYPNPADFGVNLPIGIQQQEVVTITLKNSSGVVVYQHTESLPDGGDIINIPTHTLPEGMYYLLVNGKTINSAQQIMVLHGK